MEFENNGMGKCILLKEDKYDHSLIYSITGKQFIVASDLDKKTGSWLHGHYFGHDLDSALSSFNKETEKVQEDFER